MAFPWSGRVLGDTVPVVGAEMPDSDRLGIFSFPGSARECNAPEALPGLCDKGQFDYFLTIRFLGFSFLQFRWAFTIRPEWGSNNLAQGRAQRRPGYGVRQREIALKGQNSLGSVVCVGTVCSAPLGRWALRAVAYPGRRFALPWAKMFKPVWLTTQKRNTAHNLMHSSFSMH